MVGLSHKSAPVAILEQAAVSGDTLAKLLRDVTLAESVAETFIVSTCNRVEVYAEVDRFHAGVTAVCELFARHCGMPGRELTPHLYVHYEDQAVSHLLGVACGLDSMVVGEGQILGQVRAALKLGEEHGTVGRVLGGLGRVALRAGKRARAETAIDQAGQSLVSVALELAAASLSPASLGPASLGPASLGPASLGPASLGPVREDKQLAGRDVLIVGAGSMSALAAAAASRSGAARIAVANRTRSHAERLAAGVGAGVTVLGDLPAALAAADIVVSCTGAAGHVITRAQVAAATARRQNPLVLVDLALPRDIEPEVADLPGVTLIGLDQLSGHATAARDGDVAAVRAICEAELAAYRSAVDAARVAPTVVALRAKAATVVDAELARLASRLSGDGLSGHALEEIAQTVRRVVDKLLHAPTVRVKELAGSPGGEEYAAALRVLFDLDPRAVEAVIRAAPEQDAHGDQQATRAGEEVQR